MPTKIWRVIQYGIVCAHIGSHCARQGDEEIFCRVMSTLRSQVCKIITPIQAEEVEGRYKKKEYPREGHSLQTPEVLRVTGTVSSRSAGRKDGLKR